MSVTPSASEVLAAAHRCVDRFGRAALCQILRTEGATPGKVGWKLLLRPDGSAYGNLGGGAFEDLVKRDAAQRLAAGERYGETRRYYFTEEAVRGVPTGMVCGGLAEVFLEVLVARPVFVICGGGPVGQAISAHAALLEFEVVLVDDRAEFRRPELFPEGTALPEIAADFGDDFLAPFTDRELVVAVVSRCWETDLAALRSVLRQRPPRLAYLGLLGGRRKIQRVEAELGKAGESLQGVALHAPIGLDIGAEHPGEIAVSVLAEVIRVRSQMLSGG